MAAYDEPCEVVRAWRRTGRTVVALQLRRSGRANGRIMCAEAYALLADIVDDERLPLDADVRLRIQAGRAISSRDYLRGPAERDTFKAAFAEAMDRIDALLTPTTRRHSDPARRGRSSRDAGPFSRVSPTSSTFARWRSPTAAPLWPADFAADHLPRLQRGSALRDRLCLPADHRLARAAAGFGLAAPPCG